MSGKTAILAVRILGDSESAQKALAETDKAIANTEKTTKKSGKSMKGVWTAVAAAMLGCVRASSQLESATMAVTTIYGDSADDIMAWAEGMASSGLSTAEAARAASLLGAQLKATGMETEHMVTVTTGLIETATTLAAVMGGSAVDAAAAMGAALRGEFDTLEQYGISLTADAVATKVAALAADGYTFASEQQAKMVATAMLIQEQATAIMGDAEEQSVTMTSATGHLRASLGNLAATIGGVLTPVLGPLIEGLANTIDKVNEQAESSEILRVASDILTDALEALKEILDPIVTTALELVQTVMDELAGFIEKYVTPILDLLWEVLDKVADALDTLVGWLQDAVEWFDNLTDSIGNAIDKLTFWNNEAEDVVDPSGSMNVPEAPALSRHIISGRAGTAPRATNVNITIEGATDPYATARVLTRALERYASVQGRAAGQPLAVAW